MKLFVELHLRATGII